MYQLDNPSAPVSAKSVKFKKSTWTPRGHPKLLKLTRDFENCESQSVISNLFIKWILRPQIDNMAYLFFTYFLENCQKVSKKSQNMEWKTIQSKFVTMDFVPQEQGAVIFFPKFSCPTNSVDSIWTCPPLFAFYIIMCLLILYLLKHEKENKYLLCRIYKNRIFTVI